MLKAEHVSVRYGDHAVVSDVSFHLEEGQWLMLAGPNGAGKSTLIETVSQGVPYAGRILLGGKDARTYRPAQLAKRIGVLAQRNAVGYAYTVEEIVGRYLEAQPKPVPRKKWPWLLLGFVVLLVSFRLINRLDQIDQQYQRVQMTVSHVQDSVNNQINGISDRVEEILKAQNDLTAEYGTEIKSATLTQNQITFSVYAVPKTFVEGMQASFSADDGVDLSAAVETVEHHYNQKFSANITCTLTDSIALSVTFVYPDGTKQTQLLDTYEYLYSGSMPDASVHAYDLMFAEAPGGVVSLPDHHATVFLSPPEKQLDGPYMYRNNVRDIQVGLFENKNLLCWAEPVTEPPHDGYEYGTDYLFKFPDMPLTFDENTTVYIAALITDQYGRQTVAHDIPYIWDAEDGRITHPTYSEMDADPANWDFD